ncbi:ATP-dependent DNA helicase [Trichonephila clavipes]|nr:ATP-dependent DNA helicase [Trichonephila clavipes]
MTQLSADDDSSKTLRTHSEMQTVVPSDISLDMYAKKGETETAIIYSVGIKPTVHRYCGESDEVVNYPADRLKLIYQACTHVLTLVAYHHTSSGTQIHHDFATEPDSQSKMMNNLSGTILTGKLRVKTSCCPYPNDPDDMPFEFKRLQFPVRLAFAMTINKAQRQSLQLCGLNLEVHASPHGQLMWLAHVSENLLIYSYTHQMEKTKIVLYPTALQ